eukprot:12936484-Prorocentrum_lima.AAC.1
MDGRALLALKTCIQATNAHTSTLPPKERYPSRTAPAHSHPTVPNRPISRRSSLTDSPTDVRNHAA